MSEQPETESLSIEDRLAAQFDLVEEQPDVAESTDQPEAEEAAPESEAQPEFHEIEFEGKTYQVPPELKDALLRQSDYTKKTTEVSDRQRALEQKELQLRAVENERAFHEKAQTDVAQIQEIDFQIKQWKSVDVGSLDAKQLWQLKAQIDDLKEQREKLSQGLNQKWQGFQQEQVTLKQEARAKAHEHLSKSIKGWGPEADKAICEYALSKGFSKTELDSVSDPRLVEVLWEAQQYRNLQSQNIKGKVTTAPTVKPGSSNPMPQHVKDQFAYKKQISSAKTSAEKARVIQKRLESSF